jgi:uncharacterized protein YggE
MSKKLVLGLVVAAFACVSMLASDALARNAGGTRPPKKTVTIIGTVTVTKAADGTVTAIKLTEKAGDAEVAYAVVLDDNGKKLAELDGKKVEVTGTVAGRDAVKNLTVKTSKEVKEEKPAEKPAPGATDTK